MDIFDVFGAPRLNEPAMPSERDQQSSNGWLFSLLPKNFSLKRRILELESAHRDLQEQHQALESEHAALSTQFSELDSIHSSVKNSLMASQRENADLKYKLGRLEKINAELRSAAQDAPSDNRTERPEWSKRLDVQDLFRGATTDDAIRSRFRELSKIYHPDRVNNPDGFRSFIIHLLGDKPGWLRAACYEAYLLIKDKNEGR